MPMTFNPTLLRTEYAQRATRNALALLNAAGGALRVKNEVFEGNEIRVSRFAIPENLVTRRDITSTGNATVLEMSQTDETGARISRKVGPLGIPYASAMGRTNMSEADFTMAVAAMLAEQEAIDQVDAAIASLIGALTGTTGAWVDRTLTGITTKTATTQSLLAGMKLMGDVANRIKAWVMPSAAFYDLVGDQITNAPESIGSANIYTGMPITFNKPVLVTDSALLSPSDHWILGLTEDAAEIRVDTNPISNLRMTEDLIAENARMILRADPDYAVNLLGYAYDISAGVNPANATLAATANWAAEMPVKSSAGIAIKVAAA